MGLNFGTPKIINFPFEANGKLIILGVPISKYIMIVATVEKEELHFVITSMLAFREVNL